MATPKAETIAKDELKGSKIIVIDSLEDNHEKNADGVK